MLWHAHEKTRKAIASYISYQCVSDGVLSQIVKGDEILVKYFEPKSKQQAIKLRHVIPTRKQKFTIVPSAGKITVTNVWDGKGVIHVTFLLRRDKNKPLTLHWIAKMYEGLPLLGLSHKKNIWIVIPPWKKIIPQRPSPISDEQCSHIHPKVLTSQNQIIIPLVFQKNQPARTILRQQNTVHQRLQKRETSFYWAGIHAFVQRCKTTVEKGEYCIWKWPRLQQCCSKVLGNSQTSSL